MPLRFLLLPVFIFCLSPVWSQSYVTRADAPKKAVTWLAEAEQHIAAGRASEALKTLDKALAKAPEFIDALLVYADLLLLTGDLPAAEAAFEKAIALGPDYAPLAYFLLAETEYRQGKYAEAAPRLRTYLDSGKAGAEREKQARKMLADVEFAADALRRPVPFDPRPLGPGINTDRPEYLPSLTADGRLLVYSTRVAPRNEDIYFSRFQDSAWTQGQPLPGLNTPFSEVSPSIAANGRLMVFTSNFQSERNFDLYFSELEAGRWSAPRPIGPPVNSSAWESQPSLSADGQALYFASSRGGGQGELDLWVSTRNEDGSWDEPRNLGPKINTPYKEQAPFLHHDGQTLYFMSTGHPGMGQYDLFVSRRQPDGSWGEPRNLGYPINTAANEGALFVSLDGRTAYFDSDLARQTTKQEYIGNADLFTFELYPEARPNPATYVEARVRDARTGRPLEAQVDFIRLADGRRHVRDRTDAAGTFLVVLPTGQDYALNVSRPGYVFHSENFALAGLRESTDPYRLDIELQPIEVTAADSGRSQPVVLNNVFFATGSAELLPESTTELDRLFDLLKENPALHIRINGHTDDVGQEGDNQALSENRARAVYNYLVEKGIDPERLRYRGFGESKPIAPNDSPEGRRKNRRTEFELIRPGN